MENKEILLVADTVSNEKGVDREIIFEAIEAALASAIGLGIAMIGVDHTTGMPRLTGGNLHLMDGIDFLVAIVGVFAVAEVFFFIESHGKSSAIGVKLDKITIPLRDLKNSTVAMIRSTVIGFVAGVLPGAGASLGSFLTFFAILLGSALTMKIQYYKMLYEDASFMAALITALVELRLLPKSMRKLEAL